MAKAVVMVMMIMTVVDVNVEELTVDKGDRQTNNSRCIKEYSAGKQAGQSTLNTKP